MFQHLLVFAILLLSPFFLFFQNQSVLVITSSVTNLVFSFFPLEVVGNWAQYFRNLKVVLKPEVTFKFSVDSLGESNFDSIMDILLANSDIY